VSRIYWDTMLFVYWIEHHPQYAERVGRIYKRMQQRGDRLCTSAFTLGELLAGPVRRGDHELAEKFERLFRSSVIEVIPFDLDSARHYANIRALLRVAPPDAIQLACAAAARTDLFLTNDEDLVGKKVPGIQFVAGINTDLF